MPRSKFTSKKGKEIEESSSMPPRKHRKVIIDDSSEEEDIDAEMEEEETEQIVKPDWKGRVPLSSHHIAWQPELYLEKMNKVESIKKVLVCERAVGLDDFRPFGLVTCFERLGWEENLTFNNENKEEVYMEAILEWMSTLRKENGKNPPKTTKLIGKVRGKEVVMSFETLRKLANFDSKAANLYTYPQESVISGDVVDWDEWNVMIGELFASSPDLAGDKLLRSNLKPLAKLLSMIVSQNIIPRLGDRQKVRHYDIRVLYALSTGTPMLSFRQLCMMNIWESRESLDRKMIPHCRLISALLAKQKVITNDTPFEKVKQLFFRLERLNPIEWGYEQTRTHHILTDRKSGRILEGEREDAEEEDAEEGDEEEGSEEEEDPEVQMEPGYRGVEDQPDVPTGFQTGFQAGTQRARGAGMSFEEVIQHGRPHGYNRWSSYEKADWDRNSRMNEQLRRWRESEEQRARETRERQELHARSHAFAREQDYNRRYTYDEEVRSYSDYHAGVPHQAHPRPVSWSTLSPYAQTHEHQPYPQSYPSDWLPQGGTSSSSGPSDAFGMQTMHQSLMESIFGPQLPRPEYDDFPGSN